MREDLLKMSRDYLDNTSKEQLIKDIEECGGFEELSEIDKVFLYLQERLQEINIKLYKNIHEEYIVYFIEYMDDNKNMVRKYSLNLIDCMYELNDNDIYKEKINEIYIECKIKYGTKWIDNDVTKIVLKWHE